MPFIMNTFTLAASHTTLASHTITGLTSSTSTTTITNVNASASLLFVKAVYQTLIDAGYNAILDVSTYKITVLGFSFFVLSKSATSTASKFDARMAIYTYGSEEPIVYSSYTEFNNGSGGTDLKFALMLRGDINGFVLSCRGYDNYSTSGQDTALIFVLKGVDIVTSNDAWIYGNYLDLSNIKIRLTDLYTDIGTLVTNNTATGVRHTNLYYYYSGFNTTNLISYTPVFVYYETIYVPSLIAANDELITRGMYYQIGNEIFWAAAYKNSATTSSYKGGYALIRVT